MSSEQSSWIERLSCVNNHSCLHQNWLNGYFGGDHNYTCIVFLIIKTDCFKFIVLTIWVFRFMQFFHQFCLVIDFAVIPLLLLFHFFCCCFEFIYRCSYCLKNVLLCWGFSFGNCSIKKFFWSFTKCFIL